MSQSDWHAQLRLARAGEAPTAHMRMRCWSRPGIARGMGREWLVALYPEDAEPGDRPIVVVPVWYDPDVERLEPGSTVRVWGWPVPGGAVHMAYGDLPITAAGPCDVWMLRRMPAL